MKKCVIIFAGLAVFLQTAFTMTISSVLNDGQGDFDPWNQTRWAGWYSGGKIVQPFTIDCSVKFAARLAPWEVDLSQLSGSLPRLFIISINSSIDIDGNGITIDARKEHTKNWTLEYYYNNSVNTGTDFGAWRGFLFNQTSTEPQGNAGSKLHNITLRGFLNAVEFNHNHRRKVIVENCTLKTNVWALFPRGANVVISSNTIIENHLGGAYCEYNSRDYLFANNTFRDNNTRGAVAYGDIVLDGCINHIVRENQFLAASFTPRDYHTAISLYRNQGEDGDIREYASMRHLIERNYFEGYNVAIDFSVREGLAGSNDKSGETRCYSNDNIIKDNDFKNTKIGINVRSHFNTVASNRFDNVEKPIVLFSVFYNSLGNAIIEQPNTDVYLWSTNTDYSDYSRYVPYGNGAGEYITESEKMFFIISDGTANIHEPESAKLVIAESLIKPDITDFNHDMITDIYDLQHLLEYWLEDCIDDLACLKVDLYGSGKVNYKDFGYFADRWGLLNNLQQIYTNGGEPIDVAVGNFAAYYGGDEIAVIWDEPVSKIDSKDYYTIILYDRRGLEIDRCGRSESRWHKITAGNFLPDTGFIPVNENFEIAAIKSLPDDNGMYPVYIFRKGWSEPAVVLLEDNPYPITSITAGNFLTSGDQYDEIAVVFENGSSDIVFVKPSDPSWTATSLSPFRLSEISSGDFDWLAPGSEIAAVRRADPSTKLVAAWDFETADGGILADKAPSGNTADNLTIIGNVQIENGRALIAYPNPGAIRADHSDDLALSDNFTIWVRAKIVNEPVGFVSLVDKRSFNPQQRSYAFLINNPATVDGGAKPGFFGIGGQISSDGTNGEYSLTALNGEEVIPTGQIVEMVMRADAKGALIVDWLVSKNENPATAQDWQQLYDIAYSEKVRSLFNSCTDLYIGSPINIDQPKASVEYYEVRIYNDYLNLEELAAIEPSQPNEGADLQYQVYHFKPNSGAYYQTTAEASDLPIELIAGGNFDGGGTTRDEVAIIPQMANSDGIYEVKYYNVGAAEPFKIGFHKALDVKPSAIDAGDILIDSSLSAYEIAEGVDDNFNDIIGSWGSYLLVLSSQIPVNQTKSIFWINSNTENDCYYKILPIQK